MAKPKLTSLCSLKARNIGLISGVATGGLMGYLLARAIPNPWPISDTIYKVGMPLIMSAGMGIYFRRWQCLEAHAGLAPKCLSGLNTKRRGKKR